MEMTAKKISEPFNEIKVLKLCIKHFFQDVEYVKLLSILIAVLVILRRTMNFIIKNMIIRIEVTNNIDLVIYKIFSFTCVSAFSSLVTDYTINKISAVFQTNISIKAFSNILKAEAYGQIDLISGRTQYAISEGSYATVKLFEQCFIEIFLKISYLLSDLSLITINLTQTHLVIAIIAAIVSAALHLRGALMIIDCKKNINKARGQCDKSIYENIASYEIIKSYQTESQQVEKYSGKIGPWRESSKQRAKLIGILAVIHDVLFALTSLCFAKLLKNKGETDFNKFRTAYNNISDLERTVENISSIYIKYKEAIVSSRMILYYLNKIEGFNPGTMAKASFEKNLKFENVDYKLSETYIFQNVNFEIKKGDKVCIFGKNGSGKSTISRIIIRLCHITSGSVKMDDVDIYQIRMNDYRKLITYVPQDTNLFDDTVYNNLVYGNNKSFTKVVQECKRVGIHEDIIKLNKGYNTNVGERGTSINGGLRQKIFYVRAILVDSPIYILDEPTNNLDKESANRIVEIILGDFFAGKTILVICHDHEVVKKFPRILNFTGGHITESSTK